MLYGAQPFCVHDVSLAPRIWIGASP